MVSCPLASVAAASTRTPSTLIAALSSSSVRADGAGGAGGALGGRSPPEGDAVTGSRFGRSRGRVLALGHLDTDGIELDRVEQRRRVGAEVQGHPDAVRLR